MKNSKFSVIFIGKLRFPLKMIGDRILFLKIGDRILFFLRLLYLILFSFLKILWKIFLPLFSYFVPLQFVKSEKIIINLRPWCLNYTFLSFVPGNKFLKIKPKKANIIMYKSQDKKKNSIAVPGNKNLVFRYLRNNVMI